jgi:hypothetical protein
MKKTDEELERLSSKELIAITCRLEAQIEALENEARERMKSKAAFSKETRESSPKKPR